MDFNVIQQEKFIDKDSDSTLKLTFKKLSLGVFSHNMNNDIQNNINRLYKYYFHF